MELDMHSLLLEVSKFFLMAEVTVSLDEFLNLCLRFPMGLYNLVSDKSKLQKGMYCMVPR